MTQMNLSIHQGVTTRHCWVLGGVSGKGAYRVQKHTISGCPVLGLNIGVKYLIINYLTLELASTGAGDCGFPHFFYVVPCVSWFSLLIAS